MPMFEKSISQYGTQIDSEQYSYDTNNLCKSTQMNQYEEQESIEEVEAIRLALIEGEDSIKREGYSKRSVDEIFNAALNRYIKDNGLI